MVPTEVAMRRAGAFVALTAASALVLLLFPAPAPVDRRYAVPILALFVALLLGCAAVLLSPAAAAAAPARAVLAVQCREATARELRWVGFTAVVVSTGHVVRAVVREEAEEEEGVSADKVVAVVILFLVFLAGVWTVSLSVLTGRVRSRPVPPPPPLAAPEEELNGA